MIDHIAWQLDDFTGTALTNVFLPVSPPALAAWQSVFGLTVSGGFYLRGTVNSVSEAPTIIPERPAVTLGEAVEVRWPSRLGYFYQVQSSDDLERWTNVGEPVLRRHKVVQILPAPAREELLLQSRDCEFPKVKDRWLLT